MFHLGDDRYVLEASRVVEIVPLLALKQIPQAPRGVAGLFNYRGRPVPAVDLSEITLGRPAAPRLSTRIIVVQYEATRDHGTTGPQDHGTSSQWSRGQWSRGPSGHLLGLIAEHATEIIRKEPRDFQEPGLKLSGAPYLGPVSLDPQGVIQWVREQELLPPPVRDLLFGQAATAT